MTRWTAIGAGALAAGLGVALVLPVAAAKTVRVPPSSLDVPSQGPRAVAVLAGGCFWGMEAVFQHLNGVESVQSGYAGGSAADATYARVVTETTRHAEAIRIVYDPRVISYATLLRVFFSVAHDPTQRDRQGPDVGPSYRSAIFAQTPDQLRVARSYVAQLNAAKSWGKPLATRLESGRFYVAEAEHQNFALRNPDHRYIVMWDKPKVAALRTTFPTLWRARPAA
jgi:peptide-methionine (S)-S-oxide reductase